MGVAKPSPFKLSDLTGFLRSEGFLTDDMSFHDVQLRGFSPITDPAPHTVTWFGETLPEKTPLGSVIILCPNDFHVPASSGGVFVPVTEPRRAFAKSMARFGRLDSTSSTGIATTARIAEDCLFGPDACVGEYSIIEAGVKIGASARIGDHVCIKSGTVIGHHCVIRSGVVIGGVGFGFCREPDGTWERFPHIGGVVIEDHVEIGANTVVDKSVLGKTVIGRGTKIDSLVYIAHNTSIGPENIVAAHAALAGGVSTGRGVWIGLAASIREGCHIGDDVYVGMGTVVVDSIEPRRKVVGVPGRVIGRTD
jgi:UDP-3-O-[3-hydroxymyristoyl] glucosamine N-acyltransferase